MARVTVRNMNVYPFEQKYQGKLVSFAAKGEPGDSIEMDEEEAVVFIGQFSPFKLDNKGNHDPRYYKMLKVDKGPQAGATVEGKPTTPTCPVCREQTSSWLELEAHQRLMHSDQLLRDDAYSASQKAKDGKAPAVSAGATK